jgi:hypothetical protein
MQPIKINKFRGIYPRNSESLLPDNAATIAFNIDFTREELRSLKSHQIIKTLPSVCASIFSEDGLRFYNFTNDANIEISPYGSGAASDRIYYTTNGDFRTTAKSAATTTGGEPAWSYRVGVPKPTVAPTLFADPSPIAQLGNFKFILMFHYEFNGIKYQEGEIGWSDFGSAITPVNGERDISYTFTIPDRYKDTVAITEKSRRREVVNYVPGTDPSDKSTPEGASAVVRLLMAKPENFTSASYLGYLGGVTAPKINGNPEMDLYSENSSFYKPNSLSPFSFKLQQSASASGTYTATLEDSKSEENKETRAYVYTLRNIYGEEGASSPPAVIDTLPGKPVQLAGMIPDMEQYVPLKEVCWYRTQNGGASSDYFYAFSTPASGLSNRAITATDTVSAGILNEPLSSTHYYPPNRNLQGLMNVGNGIFAAWFGTELWFSEAFKPWAWNPSNMKSFGWPIVGAAVQGSGILVATLGNPYLVYGVSPESMTMEKLNVDQAGVSKWAIASVGGRMLYASNDGLVAVDGGRGSLNESEIFFTRDVWREKYKGKFSQMQFAEYDGALIVFSRMNAFTPFMIRLDEATGAMCELSDFVANSVFYSVTTDGLYFSRGRDLYEFGGGTDSTLTWQSKEIRLADPIAYSIAKALVNGTFTIEFWTCDSGTWALRHTESIVSAGGEKVFRLPSGFKSNCWKIKITGAGRFRELRMAFSGRQLAEG